MPRLSASTLDAHPNRREILAVLARLPQVGDAELPRLAAHWDNTALLTRARAKALQPDSPLVLEVLSAFEALQALFADDLSSATDFVTVDAHVATVALKAMRDAIAGAYARPVLRRSEHRALLTAWRAVFPTDAVDEPDLGSRGMEVRELLGVLPRLAGRCHDSAAAVDWEILLAVTARLDEDIRRLARDEAWRVAVLTSRRRLWTLIRRSGAEGLGRYCSTCRHRNTGDDALRVLGLAMDAACGLLVADTLDEALLDVLTVPVPLLLHARPVADA